MLVAMLAASHADMWSAMPGLYQGVFILLALGAVHGMLRMAPKKGAGL